MEYTLVIGSLLDVVYFRKMCVRRTIMISEERYYYHKIGRSQMKHLALYSSGTKYGTITLIHSKECRFYIESVWRGLRNPFYAICERALRVCVSARPKIHRAVISCSCHEPCVWARMQTRVIETYLRLRKWMRRERASFSFYTVLSHESERDKTETASSEIGFRFRLIVIHTNSLIA